MLNVLMNSMTILNTRIRETCELRICHLQKIALKTEPVSLEPISRKNVGFIKIEPETFHLLNEYQITDIVYSLEQF